jgi:predicted ester cyclase
MKVIATVILAVLCIAVGGMAGFRLALVRERHRLEYNKSLVRQSHEIVWSNRDNATALATAQRIYADDYIVHNPAGGSRGFRQFFEGIRDNRADFPDWSESVESIVAEGDFVAVRFNSGGTQARDLRAQPGVQPLVPNKGRAVHLHEMELFRVENHKLAEQWDLWDGWEFYRQLGLYDPDRWPETACQVAQLAGSAEGR